MPSVPCPNVSGECSSEGCGEKESPLWYGKLPDGKYCKHCYDTGVQGNKKRKGESGSPRALLPEQQSAGDIPLEILRVCGVRCAAPHHPHSLRAATICPVLTDRYVRSQARRHPGGPPRPPQAPQ